MFFVFWFEVTILFPLPFPPCRPAVRWCTTAAKSTPSLSTGASAARLSSTTRPTPTTSPACSGTARTTSTGSTPSSPSSTDLQPPPPKLSFPILGGVSLPGWKVKLTALPQSGDQWTEDDDDDDDSGAQMNWIYKKPLLRPPPTRSRHLQVKMCTWLKNKTRPRRRSNELDTSGGFKKFGELQILIGSSNSNAYRLCDGDQRFNPLVFSSSWRYYSSWFVCKIPSVSVLNCFSALVLTFLWTTCYDDVAVRQTRKA